MNIYSIRNIIMSSIATIILIWAFFKNELIAKIIITPFIISSIAILGENVFRIAKKYRISNIFKNIFLVSFFTFAFGFLLFATYYAFKHQNYSLLIPVAIFLIFTLHFFKKAFFNK